VVDGVVLGRRVGPFEGRIDRDLVERYAAATGDSTPSVRSGRTVPITALVTQIWEAQTDGREALVPADFQRAATGGVHGEHDIVLHRRLVVGEPLHTYVEGHGARAAGRNSAVTLRYVTVDSREEVVAEQWWTTIYLGTTCDPVGASAPDHGFPDAARESPIGTVSFDADESMAHRYAAVTGDWSAHHFELEAARRSGFDRVFLHGLCTMGLCAQAVVALAGAGEPDRVGRLAVRFASPTFLGERVDVHVFDAGQGVVAFEAECAGARVITHGRAELR